MGKEERTSQTARGTICDMIFRKGDRLRLDVDGIWYHYTVEDVRTNNNGIEYISCIDHEEDMVLLNKATVERRIGISWIYTPREELPEDLFEI